MKKEDKNKIWMSAIIVILAIVFFIVAYNIGLFSQNITQERSKFDFPYVVLNSNNYNGDFTDIKGYNAYFYSGCRSPTNMGGSCDSTKLNFYSSNVLVSSVDIPQCKTYYAESGELTYINSLVYLTDSKRVDGSVLKLKDYSMKNECKYKDQYGESKLIRVELIKKVDCTDDSDCENTPESQTYSIQGKCDTSSNKCLYGVAGNSNTTHSGINITPPTPPPDTITKTITSLSGLQIGLIIGFLLIIILIFWFILKK